MLRFMKRKLKKAIRIVGGKSQLAKLIGVHQTLPGKWLREWPEKGIRAEHAIAIEDATNGQVKREELRPDIFGEGA